MSECAKSGQREGRARSAEAAARSPGSVSREQEGSGAQAADWAVRGRDSGKGFGKPQGDHAKSATFWSGASHVAGVDLGTQADRFAGRQTHT